MTRRSQILALSLFSTLLTASLLAALSPGLAEFGTGPTKFLMTKAEQKQWKRISSDKDAQAFIDLFWARRDPTPDTFRNEFREAFNQRIVDADAQFTTEGSRGAMSEPGRILILLGPPTKIFQKAEGPSNDGPVTDGSAGGAPSGGGRGSGPSLPSTIDLGYRKLALNQTWVYSGKELPKGTKFPQIEITFFDGKLSVGGAANGGVSGTGDSVSGGLYARSLMFDAIGSAPQRSIVSPDLKEPRKFPASETAYGIPVAATAAVPVAAGAPPDTSLKSAALIAAVDQARASADAAKGSVVWREFEPGEDGVRTGLHLDLPAAGTAAGTPVEIFGNIVDASGKVVKQFEENAGVRESSGDLFVDRAFMLPPGRYDAVFGAAKDGAPVVVGRATMDVQGDDGKPSVRELVLSSNLQPLSASQLDDAFAMGGMKVIPKANGAFKKEDRLWYVFQVRNPSRGEDGVPKIKLSVLIHGTDPANTSLARRAPEKEVMANALGEGGKIYWVGNSIPLAPFVPGKYEVLLNVTDAISNEKFTLKDSFAIE